MSAKASGYAKELLLCPSGELISAREKLVLMVLADSHQAKAGHFTYPSVETIAAESRCDRRSCQRYLEALERKGVIRRLRPANQGAGMTTFYFFPALEAIPEGWQDAALFFGTRAAEGRQKGGGRAANAQLALVERARERKPELEQKPVPPPQPPQAGAAPPNDTAEQETEDALKDLCGRYGFSARRLRLKIRAALVQRMEHTGETPAAVAAAMNDAWVRVGKASKRLFRQPKAVEFFSDGMWLDANRWPWDNEQIREEQRMAGARAGSWG